MIKWAIELGEFDIKFHPRTAIKAQALANFIIKCIILEEDSPEQFLGTPWELYVDGSSCTISSRAGLVLLSLEGIELQYALRFNFPTTNNVTEYEARLLVLWMAKHLGATSVRAYSDSMLFGNQVKGEFEAHELTMIKYLEKAKATTMEFTLFKMVHIPREESVRADTLSCLASATTYGLQL